MMTTTTTTTTWGRQRQMRTLFFAMLLLAFVQLSFLLYVGFIHTLTLDSTSPLEEFVISSILGWDQDDNDIINGNDNEEEVEMEMESDSNTDTNNGNNVDVDDDDNVLALNAAVANPMEQGVPLDNYYSRPHGNIKTGTTGSSSSTTTTSSSRPIVPLVVGGSDGSGTRAFVDVLTRLGVPMIVDDAGTMDVHASKIFGGKGWPPFAKIALKYSKNTSNYEITDLPQEQREEVKAELVKLREQFRIRYAKLRSKLAAAGRGGGGRTNTTTSATTPLPTSVSYGFKAPITMLLLPMIQAYMYPSSGFKYLHIVRDGRDVALSSNQSPVAKFYNATYPRDATVRLKQYEQHLAPVFAMHLWNDWNADLYDWERRQLQLQQQHNDASSLSSPSPPFFDFLVMRSEDLLNPESKFEALTMLADFVGSPRTPQELCCMRRKAVVDMGQSGVSGGGRFGDNKNGITAAHDSILEYYKRRKELQQKLADFAGKESPESMTARELLEAKIKYKRLQNAGGAMVAGAAAETKPAVHVKEHLLGIGNRVAKRIARRQEEPPVSPSNNNVVVGGAAGAANDAASQIRHYAVHMRQTTNPLITEFLRKAGHRKTLDPAISNLIGRRRRLSLAGGGTETTASAAAAFPARPPAQDHVLPPRIGGHAFRLMMKPGRKIPRKKEDMGDERLAKLVASQLDVLKSNALKHQANVTGVVTDRYGKWATMLRSAPELSQAMHREGARALELFGYHPPRRFMDRRPSSNGKDAFVCDETVVCPDAK